MAEDYYKTLGISRDASSADIQKAHRDLARKYHPDLHPDDKTAKKKFQQAQAAFDVLNDAGKREQYDRCVSSFELRRAQEERGRGAAPAKRGDDMAKRGDDLVTEIEVPFSSTILGGEAPSSGRRQSGEVKLTVEKRAPMALLRAARLAAVLAASIAGYLLWASVTNGAKLAGCAADGGFGCDSVLSSRWSNWLGLPVGLPAVIVYLALFATLLGIGPTANERTERDAWRLLIPLATLAAGAASWFSALQMFDLHKMCPYCVAVHSCGIALAAFVFWYAPLRWGARPGSFRGGPVPIRPLTAGLLLMLGLGCVGVLIGGQIGGRALGTAPQANRGNASVAKDDLDNAIAGYTEAIRRKPDDADAYVKRGNAYAEKVDLDKAVADYTEAIRLIPYDTDAYFGRGNAYGMKVDLHKAIADSTEAIRLKAVLADAYGNLGLAYAQKGDLDKAIANYTDAIRLNPDSAEAYYNRGVAYGMKVDWDTAIADYTEAIRLKPDYAEAYVDRGSAYSNKGDLDTATADYNEAIRLKPDYAQAYFNRGHVYGEKVDWDTAIANYTEAIRLELDDAKAYVNRGLAYAEKGDLDTAIADYNEAIRLNPDYAEAYVKRGNAYSNRGNVDTAVAEYSEAIRRKPDYAEAYVNRAHAYAQQGELGTAAADFTEAIRLNPDSAEAYYNRGVAYGIKVDWDKAIADSTEALRLKAVLAEAYGNRGIAYAQQGEFDKAIASYTEAIRLKPDLAEAYFGRGSAYAQQGDQDKAVADYTKAIRLKPDYVKAYLNRGNAYRTKGDAERSRTDLQRAKELRLVVLAAPGTPLPAEVKTWDGKHSIEKIEVTVVYFLPRDREPLPDWKERIGYFCRRIEQFHEREFQGQSTLKTAMRPEPFRSGRSTEQLRAGDANFIFFQTLTEVDEALQFGRGERTAFPILLVLSEINWRPLDDFFRVKPAGDGGWMFEGNYSEGRHFPGAESGGARATYLADRGVGWGLVSADGWRVPYSGTDCVVYHEGCGHTVGLPHPEPANNSVMSLAQYHGWLSESWLDEAQKKHLGWKPPEQPFNRKADLFSMFTALPEPTVPKPHEPVSLKLTWPAQSRLKSCRVRLQTDLFDPWREVTAPAKSGDSPPEKIELGRFDRATPVSYRLDVVLDDGRDVELWGYFQVREKRDVGPTPPAGATSSDARRITDPPAAQVDRP